MFHIGGFLTSVNCTLFGFVPAFVQPDKIVPDLIFNKMAKYKCGVAIMSFHDIIQLSNSSPDTSLDLSHIQLILPVGAQAEYHIRR